MEDALTLTQKIYIAYYGRPADPAGLSYWANRIDSEGLEAVIEAFATSPESVALYGAETGEAETTELVTAAYQQLFSREPDAEGLAFYSERITSGEFTAATAMLDILNGASNTDLQVADNKLAVAQDFTDQVTEQDLAYSGEAAAGVGRLLLDQVSASPVQELETVTQLAVEVADLASTQTELVAELIPTDGEVGDLLDSLPPEADAEDLLTLIEAVVTSALDDPSVLSSLIEAGGGSFASTLEALDDAGSLAEILNEADAGGAPALEDLLIDSGTGGGIALPVPPPPTDTTAPMLLSHIPADDADDVALNSNILLTFDSAIALGSGTITLVNAADTSDNRTIDVTAHNNQLSLSSDGTVLTINPSADLALDSDYYLEIETGAITDVAGNAYAGISDAITLNFATGTEADTTAPTLSSSTPADNATAVAAGANLVLTFDSAIVLGSGNITLVNDDDNSDNRVINVVTDNGQLSINTAGTMLTINPTENLVQGNTYHLEIAATAITDVAGNAYAGISDADALNFATAPPPDTTAPMLVSSSPADDATAVAAGANIVLTFDSAIVLGSGNITLVNDDDNSDNRVINVVTDNGQLSINTAGTMLTINPTENLVQGNTYHLEIAATAITDVAGNAYAGISDADALNFATADTTAPTLSSSTPADGADAVAAGANLVLTFDSAIVLGSGNITLVNDDDTSDNRVINVVTDNGQLSINTAGTMLTINPTENLVQGNTYHLEIAATAITDVAGNAYAGDGGGCDLQVVGVALNQVLGGVNGQHGAGGVNGQLAIVSHDINDPVIGVVIVIDQGDVAAAQDNGAVEGQHDVGPCGHGGRVVRRAAAD